MSRNADMKIYERRAQRAETLMKSPGSRTQGPGSEILDSGPWSHDGKSRIQGPGSSTQDPGSRIQGSGSRIQDPGSMIQAEQHQRSTRPAPNPPKHSKSSRYAKGSLDKMSQVGQEVRFSIGFHLSNVWRLFADFKPPLPTIRQPPGAQVHLWGPKPSVVCNMRRAQRAETMGERSEPKR